MLDLTPVLALALALTLALTSGDAGCLEEMLDEFVLPNARRDTSAQFRETTMKDAAVVEVIEEFAERLQAWYKKTTADDSKAKAISDKLGMSELIDTFDDRGLIGIWSVHQESEVVGDPTISRTEMKWKLSIPTCKSAFMDSQSGEQLGAGQASATDEMALLSFGEFQEFVARVGLDKYRPIKAMTPAAAVRAMHQNILGEKNEEQAVVEATRISAMRFDAASVAVALPGEGGAELAKWVDCWGRMAFNDMYLFPVWEQEVHDLLQPLYKELTSIFLAYTRSISEVSAEDALEMSLDEFHDFVVDVGLETKAYKFDVMCNQFIKANSTHLVVEAAEMRMASRQNSSSKQDATGEAKVKLPPKDRKKSLDKPTAKATKDLELVLYEFIAMLVRISFWRANPTHGNFGVTDEVVPVPAALSQARDIYIYICVCVCVCVSCACAHAHTHTARPHVCMHVRAVRGARSLAGGQ